MKKLRALMCIITMVFMLIGCSSDTTKKDDSMAIQDIEITEEQRVIGKDITKDIFNQNITQLKTKYVYDDKLKEMVNKESFISQIQQFTEVVGKVSSIKEPYAQSYQGSTIIYIPVVGDKEKCNVQLSLNDKNEIQGIFFKPYQELDNTKIPEGIKETDVDMKLNDSSSIKGKLTMPDKDGTYPVVILLSGSGPCDMDETIGSNKPFRSIAWSLAQQGVATYRFDKRTVNHKIAVTDTVKQEYIDDALQAIDMVQKQKNINKDKIYVLGHSEGGYVLPRVAKETKVPAGYILMSAPARPLEDLFVEQIEYLAKLDGKVTDAEQKQINAYKKEREAVKKIDKASNDATFFGVPKAYMLDLKGYDPVSMAKDIKVPVLLTQGLRDYQVTKDDLALWSKVYDTQQNWTIKTYENANHIMNDGKGQPNPQEYTTKKDMNAQFLKDLATFIKK